MLNSSESVHENDGDDSWMTIADDLMRSWEHRYCTYSHLSIFVGTYNVNGQSPTVDLSPWLNEGLDHPPDLYAIGFQELDLSQQAFLFDYSSRESEWAEVVERTLHPAHKYKELKRVRLVGILLLIYVRIDHSISLPSISVSIRTCATGLLNRMGNKGGVGISMRINDTRLCFVNSHLAAGAEELQKRNQDFRDISAMNFEDGKMIGVLDHDMSFWLGDLNYRLERPDGRNLDSNKVRQLLQSGQLSALFKYDQLIKVQLASMAFQDFEEGKITFPPTYKYDTGTDKWDSSEKARVPAWCDRVLWMCRNPENVRLQQYRSVSQVRISDHKPVTALFHVRIRKIDPKKERIIRQEAIKEDDRVVNESLPQIEMDRVEFHFDSVRFLQPVVQTLTIRNVGKYVVYWKFKKRPDCEGQLSISEPWLTVTPLSHRVDVGKESVVQLQMLVDKTVAWKLHSDSSQLFAVLVLSLRGGRDHFLTIDGDYRQSCFAQSLQHLFQLPGPIHGMQLIDLVNIYIYIYILIPFFIFSFKFRTESRPDESPPWCVPRELRRLVEHIENEAIDIPDLFKQAGSHNDFAAIREALDTGYPETLRMPLKSVALYCYARLQLSKIAPVILHDQCIRVSQSPIACRRVRSFDDEAYCLNRTPSQIVDQLPYVHKETFVYLAEFVRKVLRHSANNDSDETSLCEIFASVIFKRESGSFEGEMDRQRKSVSFLRNCLIHDRKTALSNAIFDARVF